MYRALIVDDEKIVRLTLHNMLQWEEMGIELIGEARDGQEALDMIEQIGADIIITDLKMPGVDGIELIQELNRQQFDGKILVLSNYDDFELVKSAMKLGVMDYILKVTMKVDDFKEAIIKMIHLLDQDKEKRARSIDERIQVRRGERLYRDKMVRALLLEPPTTESVIKQQIHDYQIQIHMQSNWIFYIQVDQLEAAIASDKIKDIQLLSFSIKNIITDIISRRALGEIIDISHKDFVLIIPTDQIQDHLSLAKRISDMLSMYINLSFSMVITSGSSMSLYSLVKQCERYMACKFYHQPNTILHLDDPAINYKMDMDYEAIFRDIKNYIYHKSWDDLACLFDAILDRGRKENVYPQITQNACLVLLDHMMNVYRNTVTIRLGEVEQTLQHIEFMQTYKSEINQILSNLQNENSKSVDSQDNIIQIVEAYILANIHKKITLKRAAEYVHLNPSYLSRLFKQAKGISLIDFSNQVKVDKAKEILQQKDIPIQQVGSCIGIPDPYYFNKVFKKYAGVSPSVYKKANQGTKK